MLTGLAVADPARLSEHRRGPPVFIERVNVDGKAITVCEFQGLVAKTNSVTRLEMHKSKPRLRLSPNHGRVEFEYTALDYGAPEEVIFRYRLEGLERGWVEAKTSQSAGSSHLPPGEYRFRVLACDNQGAWSEVGDSLALMALPHYWQTLWFRTGLFACSAAVVGGSAAFLLRRRYRRKLERVEQRQALERERARIAQDLHDDLGAGLVEISFGSELSQDPALSREEAREHAREIGMRAREMVTALDEIVWAVNPKHDHVSSLATYFCQFAQHFFKPTSVRCHLAVDRNLPDKPLNAEQRHSLFMAFKEALCNVAQHSSASVLWLDISARDGLLRISVRDNGSGMDLAAPRERTSADGLGNMRTRLLRLGGRCELSSKAGQGMEVVFLVPLTAAGLLYRTD